MVTLLVVSSTPPAPKLSDTGYAVSVAFKAACTFNSRRPSVAGQPRRPSSLHRACRVDQQRAILIHRQPGRALFSSAAAPGHDWRARPCTDTKPVAEYMPPKESSDCVACRCRRRSP